jgi:hypothetical protein
MEHKHDIHRAAASSLSKSAHFAGIKLDKQTPPAKVEIFIH